ncbi:hypothetical protein VP01_186g12 [Puccinia sorghi]|uniref:Uncharacterized protein n=1 Tax=Puccinia sorghi TaxID=27349 RepID=A0A0L6VDE7_9BASI|nr:hypothetical protein VP01_186g12 [Puccinia sorghi]
MVEKPEGSSQIVYLEESRKMKSETSVKTEDADDTATALMKETKKGKGSGKKSTRKPEYCSPGVHNPASSHSEKNCWNLHPELRPGFSKPEAQLAEALSDNESFASLFLTETKSKPIVLDSGASQHMINDASIFLKNRDADVHISTGGHKNYLTGTAVVKQQLLTGMPD